MAAKIIDADSHFMEPLDLFERYSESKYRERVMRYEWDKNENKAYVYLNGKRRNVNLDEMSLITGYGQKEGGRSMGGMDPSDLFNHSLENMSERVAFLDREGIDAQVIYPSLGIVWQDYIEDPDLASEHCRAYNRWAVETCGTQKSRLFPSGQITLRHPEAMVSEIAVLAKAGVRNAFLGAIPFNGSSWGNPEYDPIWNALQAHDMSAAIHPVLNRKYIGNEWHKNSDPGFMFFSMNVIQDPRMALTTMVYDGVFERFPNLRVATVEANTTWVVDWLGRLEHRWKYMGHTSGMKKAPTEYFRRNIWLSAEADEIGLEMAVKIVGSDKFFFGSDYPHAEGTVDPVKKARASLEHMGPEVTSAILGRNAARFFAI